MGGVGGAGVGEGLERGTSATSARRERGADLHSRHT